MCNSAEGSVTADDEPVAYFSGYARGLAFAPDGTMYVGTSLARRPMQPTDDVGIFDNPTGEGALHGACAVIHMAPDGTNRFEIAIPPFGNEIYDILVL